jgi:hypothetical protein
MTAVTHEFDDGSVLVVLDVLDAETEPDEDLDLPVLPKTPSREDVGAVVLGPINDVLVDFSVNGLVYGIAGNAAWDLLKSLGSRLRERGLLGGCQPMTVREVARIVKAQSATRDIKQR